MKKNRGITLLELTLSLALMGMLWSLVAVPLNRAIALYKGIQEDSMSIKEGFVLFDHLSVDLSNVISDMKFVDSVLTLKGHIRNQGGSYKIVYEFQNEKISRSVFLIEGRQLSNSVISQQITHVQIKFKNKDDWFDSWDKKILPESVFVKVEYRDQSFFENVFIIWKDKIVL